MKISCSLDGKWHNTEIEKKKMILKMVLLKKCFIKELVTNITFIFKHQTKKLVCFTDSKIENPAKFNGNIGNILFLACNFSLWNQSDMLPWWNIYQYWNISLLAYLSKSKLVLTINSVIKRTPKLQIDRSTNALVSNYKCNSAPL